MKTTFPILRSSWLFSVCSVAVLLSACPSRDDNVRGETTIYGNSDTAASDANNPNNPNSPYYNGKNPATNAGTGASGTGANGAPTTTPWFRPEGVDAAGTTAPITNPYAANNPTGGAVDAGTAVFTPVYPVSVDISTPAAQVAEEAQARGDRVAAMALATGNTILFDYDSDEIAPDFRKILDLWAKNLNASLGLKVRLEGHADERGSSEYNLALGERRAKAVEKALLLRGVAQKQLSSVSFGEEQPLVEGSSEEVYRQNRRVELIKAQ